MPSVVIVVQLIAVILSAFNEIIFVNVSERSKFNPSFHDRISSFPASTCTVRARMFWNPRSVV